MYSMVLVASLATAGDAPEFGKKSSGGAGCNGAVVMGCSGYVPAGCSGYVSSGCNGGGRQGLFGRHKDKGTGCSGYVSSGCSGYVPAGCSGVPAGCNGGGRQGLFSRHKNKGNGCSGVTVVAAPCGCCGTPAVVVGTEVKEAKEMPKVENKK